MKQKNKKLEQLKFLYLFVFVLGGIIIAPTHLFPQPYFMYARFPHYLEMMKPFMGISWPLSFEIYHYILLLLAIIGSLNALGVIFYPKFNKAVIASSLIGLFLISAIVLFFFLQFISVNALTAVIFGLYSLLLLIVDALTFQTFIAEQKEA
ncbi:MAG: hypothetical protein HY425_00870 [Candidatus Levybacteria bacterium]|nr:hypothetical protein [Candidatus Levybacteria bacterium]